VPTTTEGKDAAVKTLCRQRKQRQHHPITAFDMPIPPAGRSAEKASAVRDHSSRSLSVPSCRASRMSTTFLSPPPPQPFPPWPPVPQDMIFSSSTVFPSIEAGRLTCNPALCYFMASTNRIHGPTVLNQAGNFTPGALPYWHSILEFQVTTSPPAAHQGCVS